MGWLLRKVCFVLRQGWLCATFIYLSDFLQPFVILKEESQVHERHVHIWISSVFPVLLDRVFPSRECMLVDLCEAGTHQERGMVFICFDDIYLFLF